MRQPGSIDYSARELNSRLPAICDWLNTPRFQAAVRLYGILLHYLRRDSASEWKKQTYKLNDGTGTDVYRVVVKAIADDLSKVSYSYEELLKRTAKICSGESSVGCR